MDDLEYKIEMIKLHCQYLKILSEKPYIINGQINKEQVENLQMSLKHILTSLYMNHGQLPLVVYGPVFTD